MTPSAPRRFIVLQSAVSLALLVGWACQADRPVNPTVPDPSFGKSPPSSDPAVTSTTPSSANRDTTLNVTVAGSGFDQGSRAVWALKGDTTFAKTKVKTNATTYVSTKQLIANITVALDATIDLYDVQVVTFSGRKGIGIELFAVTPGITITAVGPATGSIAYDVNSAGQVAGTLGTTYSAKRAFVWTPTAPRGTTGSLSDIGTLGGTDAMARGINSAGQVVGGAVGTAMLWTLVGGMKALGLPAGATSGYGSDVNDAGQLVGYLDNRRPALWTVAVSGDGSVQVSAIEELGALPGATGQTLPFAINGLGQAVGWSSFTDVSHAVLWTKLPGGWIIEDLDMLAGGPSSVAQGMNDGGLVVGYRFPVPGGCELAMIWTTQAGRRTGMHALPSLGGCAAEAYGINNAGDVVGRALTQNGFMHAVLWTVTPDGSVTSMRDLGSLNRGQASLAYRVSERFNNIVQVVGFSATSKGTQQATLWTIK